MGQSPLKAAAVRRVLVTLAGFAFASGCAREEPSLSGGAHTGVACSRCHQATRHPATVGTITADACTECHEDGLSAEVELATVRFAHSPHADFAGGGTPCSACHTHASGDRDLEVDEVACWLCHAELPGSAGESRPAHLPEESCLVCHGQPTHVAFAGTGAPIDHRTVRERGISCLQCHYDLVEGSGGVAPHACGSCHAAGGVAAPLRGGESHGTAVVHEEHYGAGLRPACGRCHETVDHHVGSLSSALGLDCGGCHRQEDPALAAPVDSTVHEPQQLLYTGLVAASDDAIAPAVKFVERVACTGCHSPTSMEHADDAGVRITAIEKECTACHGLRHGKLLDGWVRGMQDRVETVDGYLEAALADTRVRSDDSAAAAVGAAREAWELVRAGGGVHNVPAAHRLLQRAVASVERAWEAAGIAPPPPPPLGPDPATESCARCHYGVETHRAEAFGATFDHGVHLMGAGLACEACHSDADLVEEDGRTYDPRHGRIEVGAVDCRDCHHRDAAETSCESCHAGEETRTPMSAVIRVGVDGVTRERPVALTHADHRSVACHECHRGQTTLADTPAAVSCTECHTRHHAARRGCATCHASEHLEGAHARPVDAHRACDACHDPATVASLVPDRGLCSLCHDPGADHYAASGFECTECHFLAASADYRTELSGREGR